LKKICFVILLLGSVASGSLYAQYKMEYLTRGVHAVNNGKGQVFISWRLLGTEDNNLTFNLYRTTNKKTIQLNKQPIITATNFTDEAPDTNQTNIYTVKAIINNKEEKAGSSYTLTADAKPYLSIQQRRSNETGLIISKIL